MTAPYTLAIDPGPVQSAWIGIGPDGRPVCFAKEPNDLLLERLRSVELLVRLGGRNGTDVAIENIEPRFGITPGWTTLDTARWTGRFQEALRPVEARLVLRSQVLRALGVVTRGEGKTSADAGVRAALIDRYGGPLGKSGAIGLKASPGPLYGVAADVWAALAVAVAVRELEVTP